MHNLKELLQNQSKNWLIDHIIELNRDDDNQILNELALLKTARDLNPFWERIQHHFQDAINWTKESESMKEEHGEWDAGPKQFIVMINIVWALELELYAAKVKETTEYALRLIAETKQDFPNCTCLDDPAGMLVDIRKEACAQLRQSNKLPAEVAHLAKYGLQMFCPV